MPKPKTPAIPIILKKLSLKTYLALETEWHEANSRYSFGKWFMLTYYPNVKDNRLFYSKDTHSAALTILEDYVK